VSEEGFPDTSGEVSGQNSGGRPRKWDSDAERKAAKREEAKEQAAKAAKDEEFIRVELEITRLTGGKRPGADHPIPMDERLERSEEYLRKWVAGDIGPRIEKKEKKA